MRILLINPKNIDLYSGHPPHPPLGLLYIASYIKEKGFNDIKVLDCVVNSPATLYKEISKADVIGVGAYTSQFKHAIEISKICKKQNRLSICGGVHVSAMPEASLKISDFDIAVKGEGELTFYELIKRYYNNGERDFNGIDGAIYKDGDKIITNRNRDYIKDINQLPFPARDFLSIEKYKIRDEFFSSFFTTIQSTRGCPFECTFCNSPRMWSRRVRFRSADNIVTEMSELYHKYDFRCFQIADDSFTYSRQIVAGTCNLIIKKRMNIEWSCVSRPELLDLQLLELMKKAGCIRISIGVESGDLRILERAKKRYSLKKIEEAVKLIKKAGLFVHCYMMIGLPGEDLKTYWKSIRFTRRLKPDRVGWAVAVPFPGTELYDKQLVEIVDKDYLNWGGYLRPVIKVGKLSPVILRILQIFANLLTQKRYQKRNIFISTAFALMFFLPVFFLNRLILRIRNLFRCYVH